MSFVYFVVTATALVGGVWFMLKDIPGGIVQKATPNSFRSKPWDVA